MSGSVEFASDTGEVWDLYQTLRGIRAYDIGANGGLTANILAGGFTEVIACEPAIESYAHLEDRALDNVITVQVAISDHDGEVTFRETPETERLGELFTGSSLPWGETIRERTLPCRTLDSLTAEFGPADFIKIDTEGHECLVLDGAHDTFKTPFAFVIEIHSKPNGQYCKDFLDARSVPYREVLHSLYREISPWRYEHYWLVNT